MDLLLPASVILAMAGMIFTLGRYSVRVENLERWRDEVRGEFKEFHGHLLRFEKVLLEEKGKP